MTEPTCICPLDMTKCPVHTRSATTTFAITPEHMPMIRLLLGRHTADTITDDALDELYAERDQLAAAVQRVRDLHRPESEPDPQGAECAGCGDSPHHIDYGVTWPCDTIRALDAQPEPAADTETATRLTDHWPTGDRDA